MEQLTLKFGYTEDYLRNLFEKATGREISLTVTDNSTSMLSVKTKGKAVSVRLHRIFLEAGANVVDEIAEFIKKRGGKTPHIRDFIRGKRDILKKKVPRRLNAVTRGRYYDILNIYESINREYFEEKVSASITWGTKSPRRAVRRRTLGSYSSHSHMIRINPILDIERVPPYFVEFIVYHEMLHACLGVKNKNGRRSVHSKEFRELERRFRDYEKAMAWEKKSRI